MSDIDIETGLPKLPENFFWRVREGSLSTDRVELRKKLRFGSVKVDSRVARYYADDGAVLDPRDEILRLAKRIFGEFNDPWTEYRGDYPPKSL